MEGTEDTENTENTEGTEKANKAERPAAEKKPHVPLIAPHVFNPQNTKEDRNAGL